MASAYFYDDSRIDALQLLMADQDEPLCFGFKVVSRDPVFVNYTMPAVLRDDEILYFDSRKAKTETTGKLRLHADSSVSDKNFEKLNAPVLEGLIGKKEKLVKPHFLINIWVEAEKTLPKPLAKSRTLIPAEYYLKFKARQTYWKYYLLGAMAKNNPYIADLNNKTEFEATGNVSLPNERTALTFRSKAPIPLQEKFDQRFQLRTNGTREGKVLLKRLPVASTSQIDKEVVEGKEVVVSEIFINC
ncbi:MAG: hypothetical protein GKS05_12065 [Nitrospirales bacterium]|nr:hypothetical protein [Nitrospirales bacterium]